MKYRIDFGSLPFVCPERINEYIKSADRDSLAALLALLSLRGECDESAVCALSGVDIDSVKQAIAFWRGTGIISVSGEEQTVIKPARTEKAQKIAEIPQYSGEELETLISKNSLRELIDECQSISERIFNPTEINKLVAMREYLGLETEHILMLFIYCKSIGKTSLRYIEKTAYSLYDEGIDSLSAFEDYIKRKEELDTLTGKLRKLFGAKDRSLTPKEKAYIACWYGDWGFSYDIIELAYQVTVDNTDKFSLPYLNKVLSNWHDDGLSDVEAIKASLESFKSQKSEKKKKGSFDTDEFFAAALKKSMEKANLAVKKRNDDTEG